MSDNAAAARLDTLMNERRLELGLRWKDVNSAAEITHQTMRMVRAGRRVEERTERNVERALRWDTGSIRRVLDGGDPLPVPSYSPLSGQSVVDGETVEISTAVITDQLEGMTPEEKQELIDHLAEITTLELRRRRKATEPNDN